MNYSKWDSLADSDDEDSTPAKEEESAAHQVASAKSLRALGNECWDGGDVQGAVDRYEAALRILDAMAGNAEADAVRDPCLLNVAAAMLKLEDFAGAERRCSDALLRRPTGAALERALFFRGVARHRRGQLSESLVDLKAAIAAGAEGEAQQLLITVRRELDAQERAKATEVLATAVEEHAGDPARLPAAAAALARAQAAAGDGAAALKTLEAALGAATAARWPAAARSYLLRGIGSHHQASDAVLAAVEAYQRAAALWEAEEGTCELDEDGEMRPAAKIEGSASKEAILAQMALGRALVRAKRPGEALVPLRTARAALTALGAEGSSGGDGESEALKLKCLDALTEALAREELYEEALGTGQEAVVLAERLGKWRIAGDTNLSLGHLELQRSPPSPAVLKRAADRLEAGVAALEKSGALASAADAHMQIAMVFQRLGQPVPLAGDTESGGNAASSTVQGHLLRAAELYGASRKAAPAPAAAAAAALAQREEVAWGSYAAALGDGEDDERLRALRRVAALQDAAPDSVRAGNGWPQRRSETLHSLALSAARLGDFATAEQGLMDAIAALEAPESSEESNQARIRELYQCLAVARRRRGDIPGAQEALDAAGRVAAAAGAAEEGEAEAEALNRALQEWRIWQ